MWRSCSVLVGAHDSCADVFTKRCSDLCRSAHKEGISISPACCSFCLLSAAIKLSIHLFIHWSSGYEESISHTFRDSQFLLGVRVLSECCRKEGFSLIGPCGLCRITTGSVLIINCRQRLGSVSATLEAKSRDSSESPKIIDFMRRLSPGSWTIVFRLSITLDSTPRVCWGKTAPRSLHFTLSSPWSDPGSSVLAAALQSACAL